MLYGQDNFISKLNKYTLNTLPHSILLLGDKGSCQYEICEYISTKFNLNLYDLSCLISKEYINQIVMCSVPSLYVIDINKIEEKEQNILLKLFEEPSSYSYIILYGESTLNLLDTIINRSYIMTLDRYSKEQLSPLVTKGDKDLILSICNTPGQIEIANHTNIEELKILCDKIVSKINIANIENTLSISNKINFKDEYDKYDLSLFIKMLGVSILNSSQKWMYDYVLELNKYIKFMNDKKSYFQNFLIKIWRESRNERR